MGGKVFGAQTNSRAEAMAFLRVLQYVHWPHDLHAHTYLNSIDFVLCTKQYYDRQWRTPTRQKLMQCDVVWTLPAQLMGEGFTLGLV